MLKILYILNLTFFQENVENYDYIKSTFFKKMLKIIYILNLHF